MAGNDKTVELLLNEIRNTQEKLKRAELKKAAVSIDKAAFQSFFESHPGRYVMYGLLCVTVMVFDFIVNGRTMVWLARMLQTGPAFIATILTLVDGFLAIQASGIFDVKNPILMERSKRKWQIILWSLAFVKMIAYVVFVVMRSQIVNADTGQAVSTGYGKVAMMAIPQLIFIIVIYSLLHICGSGLWYFIGSGWYGIRSLQSGDPSSLRKVLHKHATDLKSHCKANQLDYEAIRNSYKDALDDSQVSK